MAIILVKEPEESIDREVFAPLAEFLAAFDMSDDALERIISESDTATFQLGRLKDENRSCRNYSGVVLEAYVKQALAHFAVTTDGLLVPARIGNGILPDGCRFFMGQSGNVRFETETRKVTEVDDLYEMRAGRITPVIFEISSSMSVNTRLKMRLIAAIYDIAVDDLYFCKIRPAKDGEELGVYGGEGLHNHKKILVPRRPQIYDIATKFWINYST